MFEKVVDTLFFKIYKLYGYTYLASCAFKDFQWMFLATERIELIFKESNGYFFLVELDVSVSFGTRFDMLVVAFYYLLTCSYFFSSFSPSNIHCACHTKLHFLFGCRF